MTEHPTPKPDDLANLEKFIRNAAPRRLPADLRTRILVEMAGASMPPKNDNIVPIRRFLAVASAVMLLSALSALMLTHRQYNAKQDSVIGILPAQSGLDQTAFGTSKVGHESLGPIIDVNGQAIRLVKSYELATQVFEEPKSGAVVQISYPQTRYQFVNSPIQ